MMQKSYKNSRISTTVTRESPTKRPKEPPMLEIRVSGCRSEVTSGQVRSGRKS